MPVDLDNMRRHPGSVNHRDLTRALTEHGWELARTAGKHEVWVKGSALVMVPRTVKGTGTIRRILDVMIANE